MRDDHEVTFARLTPLPEAPDFPRPRDRRWAAQSGPRTAVRARPDAKPAGPLLRRPQSRSTGGRRSAWFNFGVLEVDGAYAWRSSMAPARCDVGSSWPHSDDGLSLAMRRSGGRAPTGPSAAEEKIGLVVSPGRSYLRCPGAVRDVRPFPNRPRLAASPSAWAGSGSRMRRYPERYRQPHLQTERQTCAVGGATMSRRHRPASRDPEEVAAEVYSAR